jgi:glycosyltransferase involved in cell wall biosynthesis
MHGVKRLFAWMIPRFDPARYDVSLVSLRKKDTSEDTLDELGIRVDYLHRSKFDPATYPDLLKLLDRKQTDIVHLHGYGATTFGRLVAARRGWPVVLHEHANLTDTPWFQKIPDKLLAPVTDVAIAVSASTANFVVNARLVPRERTKVVYLGVPLEEFARERTADEVRAARARLGIGEGELGVGTITRLMPSKGNQYFVEAIAHAAPRLPHARFLVVGEGELQADLEAQARALGVADRVRFTGFERDVAAALSAFDIAVFPSLWEGTPLTAFEALAMGKAIVSTDADGLTDILTGGTDAVIVPKRDGRALADAICDLAARPDERARLSAHARATGAKYDIRRFVGKMERLYDLLHETSRATRRRSVVTNDVSFLEAP